MAISKAKKLGICNELPSSTVGWVIARGTVSFGVWEFESGRFSFSFFFSKFLSLVSHFRVRLSVRIGFRVRVRVKVRSFEPSSPIVRELVLSLTQLSFPLVRFKHNPSGRFPRQPLLPLPSLLIFLSRSQISSAKMAAVHL